MTSIDIDTIAGPDGESFKFNDIGDTVKGVIAHMDQVDRVSNFSDKMERVLVISLEQDDGEIAKIYPVTNTNLEGDGYATKMAKAVAAAVRAAGCKSLEAGGTLALKFSGEKPTDKGNPAKLFEAQYKAPEAPAVQEAEASDGAVSDLLG